jgi:hypothetical protein
MRPFHLLSKEQFNGNGCDLQNGEFLLRTEAREGCRRIFEKAQSALKKGAQALPKLEIAAVYSLRTGSVR